MPPTTQRAPAQPKQQTHAQPAPVNPDAALLDEAIGKAVERLDRLSARCLDELHQAAGSALRKAMVTSRAIELLDQALTPEVMHFIMRLMNTPLGFLTDKDPEKNPKCQERYDVATVKRVMIEALLKGVDWIGNQLNIISGRLYITQEGYARKCREVPGLTNLELIPGSPQVANGITLVRMGARWKLNGVPNELRDAKGEPGIYFPVQAASYSTADNLIGKAKRKAYKLIYERATGSDQPDDDESVAQQVAAVVKDAKGGRTDALAGKIAGNGATRTADTYPGDDAYQQQVAADGAAKASMGIPIDADQPDPEPTPEEMGDAYEPAEDRKG